MYRFLYQDFSRSIGAVEVKSGVGHTLYHIVFGNGMDTITKIARTWAKIEPQEKIQSLESNSSKIANNGKDFEVEMRCHVHVGEKLCARLSLL
jgi:hypothetical protein